MIASPSLKMTELLLATRMLSKLTMNEPLARMKVSLTVLILSNRDCKVPFVVMVSPPGRWTIGPFLLVSMNVMSLMFMFATPFGSFTAKGVRWLLTACLRAPPTTRTNSALVKGSSMNSASALYAQMA